MASATEEPGGMTAVNLQVAQRYVDAFAKIADQSNTLVVPANMGDLASLITSSMAIVEGGSAKPNAAGVKNPAP